MSRFLGSKTSFAPYLTLFQNVGVKCYPLFCVTSPYPFFKDVYTDCPALLTGTHAPAKHWTEFAVFTVRTINPADIEFLPFKAAQYQLFPGGTNKAVCFLLIFKIFPREFCFVIHTSSCSRSIQTDSHILQGLTYQAGSICAVRTRCFDG